MAFLSSPSSSPTKTTRWARWRIFRTHSWTSHRDKPTNRPFRTYWRTSLTFFIIVRRQRKNVQLRTRRTWKNSPTPPRCESRPASRTVGLTWSKWKNWPARAMIATTPKGWGLSCIGSRRKRGWRACSGRRATATNSVGCCCLSWRSLRKSRIS